MVIKLERLKKRADFLSVAKGKRWNLPAFTLQANLRLNSVEPETKDLSLARLGFTVTKKIGNSVKRNRVKRRLRSAIQKTQSVLTETDSIKADYDYVLVARSDALTVDFVTLTNDLSSAFKGVHRQRSSAKATRE
jgi:ribonuclease P protein component